MSEGAIYLANVRRLPCSLHRGRDGRTCNGRVHAHHAGERPGMGRKASDFTAVPLCAQHHAEWHNASGAFASLDQAQRRAWAERAIAATREALAPF
jgi:hypothetical protein